VGRRLIGWIAAYALVLQAALSGIVTTQLAATKAAHGFEICLTEPDGARVPASHTQHASCAIHCNAVAGGAPAVAPEITAALFPALAGAHIDRAIPAASFDRLRRDGLGSRAPPSA
jgi:hypothetical protein